MRATPLTPYLPLPRTAATAAAAPAPRPDAASGGFTFERLLSDVPLPSVRRTDRRITTGSPTAYSAAAFAVAFVLYLAVGFACLAGAPVRPPRGAIGTLEGATCVTAYRHAHHSEARIYLGSPPREVRLLVRIDTSKTCASCGSANATATAGASVVIAQSGVLHSSSLVCDADSTVCTDVAIVSHWRGGAARNELRPLRFHYGAQHLAGLEALRLGLDGEITLCRDVSYELSTRQLCAASTTAIGPERLPCAGLAAHPASRPQLRGSGEPRAFGTSACDLRAAGGLWATTPAAHARCSACNTTVQLFPAAAGDVDRWYTVAAQKMDTSSAKTVGATRVAVEAGGACAPHDDPAVRDALLKFDIACAVSAATGATDGTACGRDPSVAPTRVSGHGLRVDVGADGGACFVVTGDPLLHANAAMGAYGQPAGSPTAGEAWLRLLLMVFAAAIVWVRRDDAMENADHLFVRCVQISAEGASRTIVDVDGQTRALGLVAAVARLALAATAASAMTADGQMRVVATECTAASLSIVHWVVLYGGAWVTPVRALKDAGLRPALGGSSAIVDVTCATMMAFSTTPVRGDVDSFDVIARLLTAVLLGVACISRCLLSAACSGALTQCRFGTNAPCRANTLALAAAVFWWCQAISIAVVSVDLFATPVSINWARTSTGSPQSAAALLFVGASLISAPRLTANAVAVVASIEESKEGEGGDKADGRATGEADERLRRESQKGA